MECRNAGCAGTESAPNPLGPRVGPLLVSVETRSTHFRVPSARTFICVQTGRGPFVLASGMGQFTVVSGGSAGIASSSLTISEPVIQRVARLRARWAYGR